MVSKNNPKSLIERWNRVSVDDLLPHLKLYISQGHLLHQLKIPSYSYPEDVLLDKILCVDSYGYYLYGDEKSIKKLKSTTGGIARRILKSIDDIDKPRGRRIVIPVFNRDEEEMFQKNLLGHMKRVGYKVAEGTYAKMILMEALRKRKE